MSTANILLLPTPAGLVPLDLFDDTALLPTFQANDRTKPESIQSDYSPEFEVPGTTRNHRLLRHAATSQPTQGQAYARLPCVLTSGGVEILPLGLLYVKGYREGRYQLQLAGGNRRLVEALGEKMLSDLDLSRFNHAYTPANVLAALPYDHWETQGWGYELFDRGKPLDYAALDPYELYPSVAGSLVLAQILADAGFTADSLSDEPLFTALNVPAANPYEYPQAFRDARRLQAGYSYSTAAGPQRYFYFHNQGFAEQKLLFTYADRPPYHLPDYATGTSYTSFGTFTAGTLGYYDLSATVPTFWGCNESLPGKVRVKFMLKVNGQSVFGATGGEPGKDEAEGKGYQTQTFSPKLSRFLLQPGDTVELCWRGDEIPAGFIGPDQPRWSIGPHGSQATLPGERALAAEVQFTAVLLPDFPPGGLVRLQDWLPEMKQLDFVKAYMLLGGLTIQADAYTNHLRLATGTRLFANLAGGKVLDWTKKRDAYAPPGRLPERALAFRFGSYAQVNKLKWAEDERVTAGYGDGTIAVADEVLPTAEYTIATLPFAASLASEQLPGLLAILNHQASDITVQPTTYSKVEAKPRVVLRSSDRLVSGQLVLVPANTANNAPAQLAPFTTTASYFAGADVSLLLDGTVLTQYWADLRAMLDQSRYLTERYRLTPADIAALDFTVPIWDGVLGDYFAVSAVSEYDARRPTEVKLVRLNATHLPPPVVPGAGLTEWWGAEFYNAEFY